MTRVLVTGAGAVLGQGILKSLARAGDRYTVHSFDPNPLSVGLHWTSQAGLLPLANDASYAARVEQALERVRPAVVLVGTDVELAIFAERRAAWEQRFDTHILVSPPEIIEVADDKYQTVEWLHANGLPYPETALADDRAAVAALVENCGFPVIVKPRRGARSVGVCLIHDRTSLDNAIVPGTDQIVQQYAGPEGEEYTAGILYFDGAVKAQIVLRRDLRDGNTYRAFSGDFPGCEDYVRRVGEALKPHGPANFQFRRHASGEFKLFEINARFSGTTPMRALLGFNEVDMALRYLTDGQPVEQPAVTQGIVLRYLEEQLVTNDAVERLRAAG